MSYEPHAHQAQVLILRHLLFSPEAGFADMQKTTDLTSDHFNFHVKKLVDEGYVKKQGRNYGLTNKGKEYANRMDTDENEIEKQPKVSVVITVERTNRSGDKEYLCQQRLKNPYYGFWGRPQGKMRWGETVSATAKRELKEETGLVAEPELRLFYHIRDYEKASGRLLVDKIFLCTYVKEYKGKLLEEFEGGKNAWMTSDQFKQLKERFINVDDIMDLTERGETFAEREFFYDESEY